MRRLIAIWILALLCCGTAHAQDADIAAARKALTDAAAALDAAGTGDQSLAALGKAVAAQEEALAAYRDGLRRLAAREATMSLDIARDREQLEQLVSALQSLGQAPRSALLAFPGGPVGAARAASMMAEMSPALSERIVALRTRLDTLRQLRTNQDVIRIEARGALAGLQELRSDTTAALGKRNKDGLAKRSDLQEQARLLEQQVANLEDLAQGVSALGASTGARLVEPGTMSLPAAGEIIGRMGDPDPWGRPGYGLTLAVPAYGQVIAPVDGTVRYAGPLIDYGIVVILEPQSDMLIVLAGLENVDRLVGETVLSGERLGDMGGPIPASDEFLLEASTDRDQIKQEKLYIELRRAGRIVDPAAWFELKNKESGG